jgi:hypothetical protein
MLYLDTGPVAKSATFRRVMAQLGVDVRTHMPRGSDGGRLTPRSKGKVERPFRTVKSYSAGPFTAWARSSGRIHVVKACWISGGVIAK